MCAFQFLFIYTNLIIIYVKLSQWIFMMIFYLLQVLHNGMFSFSVWKHIQKYFKHTSEHSYLYSLTKMLVPSVIGLCYKQLSCHKQSSKVHPVAFMTCRETAFYSFISDMCSLKFSFLNTSLYLSLYFRLSLWRPSVLLHLTEGDRSFTDAVSLYTFENVCVLAFSVLFVNESQLIYKQPLISVNPDNSLPVIL